MHWTSIHLLRAFAAYAVVLHHIPQFLDARVYPIKLPHFEIGAAGVDIFFVISGFVMHLTSQKRGLTALDFVKGRIVRVMPMYWFVTALVGCSALLIPSAFSTFRVTADDLLKSVLFIPIFDLEGQIRPILYVAWTLFFEFAFYGFVAAALLFKTPRPALLGAIFMAMVSLSFSSLGTDLRSSFAIIFSAICVEFLFGVLVSFVVSSDFWRNATSSTRIFTQLFFLSVAVLSFSSDVTNRSLDWDRVIGWGIPSAAFVFIAAANDSVFVKLASLCPWAKAAGDASYSLYLLHGLTFSVVYKATAFLNEPMVTMLLLAAAPLLVARFAYEYVEMPLSRVFGVILKFRV